MPVRLLYSVVACHLAIRVVCGVPQLSIFHVSLLQSTRLPSGYFKA